MKKIKEIYSQPQCETLVIRFEGCLCVSDPAKVYRNGGGGVYDSDAINDNDDY